MNWLKKKTIATPSEETVEVPAAELWRVEWYSMDRRIGGGLGMSRPQVEVFMSKEDAVAFAHRLEEATQLLKDNTKGPFDDWSVRVVRDGYIGIKR